MRVGIAKHQQIIDSLVLEIIPSVVLIIVQGADFLHTISPDRVFQ
jgi:hypothetical protein